MKKGQDRRTGWRDPAGRGGNTAPGLAVLFGLALLAALSGCGGSDPSGPEGDPTFRYDPDRSEVEITILNSQFFKVTTEPAGGAEAHWYVDGEKQLDGTGFNFFPSAVGLDTVRVEVSAGGASDVREWLVRVVPTADELPGEVQGVAVEHAPEPGEAVVNWLRVSATTYPIADYLVAVSYAGPISAENWAEATELEVVPHVEGELQYSRIYDLEDGERVWVAVRARDELGQLSDITRTYDHLTSYPWSIGVKVQEAGGGPVSEVILRWVVNGQVRQGNTPYDGYYEIGPFRNIDIVRFETQINQGEIQGEYYDYVNPDVTVDDAPLLDIHLIPRRLIDAECTTRYGDREFLHYLRERTRTAMASAVRPNHQLLHWDSYPLRVHVPEFTRSDGLQLHELVLAAMANWNTVMGEDYFVRTSDEAEAQVLIQYTDPAGAYGEVTLLEPAGYGNYIEAAIPEVMGVALDATSLTSGEFFTMTMLHELGHVLGIYEHTDCTHSSYLMNRNPSSSLDDPNGGIHPDEQLVARMVRHLPQATEMDLYVID